jgi:hypothetical protein
MPLPLIEATHRRFLVGREIVHRGGHAAQAHLQPGPIDRL